MKHNFCGAHAHSDTPSPAADVQVAIDPVCGMKVNVAGARNTTVHGGHTYYFCSPKCLAKFAAEPERYLARSRAPEPEMPAGTIYTCPMHPQIRQAGPGSCPICGMALEPELVSAESGPNPELADMTRRFWIGLALAVPVMALEMGGHLTNLHMVLGQKLSNWLQFALATPVVLWAGWPFFVRGWQSLLTRNLNMFTLIAMGTGVAWIYSVIAVVVPGLFPAAFRGPEGTVAVYFEAASAMAMTRRRAQSAPCSTSRPRRRVDSKTTGPTRKSRSTRSVWATGCACGRAKRCRSMARWPTAAHRSTSRW
jgi:P-type Cu+ transporter